MSTILDRDVRTKLSLSGVDALNDAELVSIIIGEGGDGLSAVELAQRVLDSANGSLSQLATMDLTRIRMVHGLGVKRAALLCTAFEIGRRSTTDQPLNISSITSNEDVLAIFSPILSGLAYEEFWVLYLSSANRILHKVRVSQGGVCGTSVDYKLIVKRAVELLSSSFIVVHNHPSGVAQPSQKDIAMTDKLRRASELFDIKLLDHLIISDNESFSFSYNGLLA